MSKIFIINGHEFNEYAKGELNTSLVEKAKKQLEAKGHTVKVTTMEHEFTPEYIEEQLQNMEWADKVILQTPLYWMSVSAAFKKYMDIVFTAGLGGRLCNHDGRSEDDIRKNYGKGGVLNSKYMISLTCNAPEFAFNNPEEYLFEGKNVDDLLLPMHANFRFFGMTAMPTFVCYDVMKNPDVENDFKRFEQHINENF